MEVKECPKCGTLNGETSTYCKSCGNSLNNSAMANERPQNNSINISGAIKAIFVLIVIIGAVYLGYNHFAKSDIVGKWENNKELVEFRSDGSMTAGYYWLNGKYTLEDDDIIDITDLGGKQEYTYKIDGDTLTLKEDGYKPIVLTRVDK